MFFDVDYHPVLCSFFLSLNFFFEFCKTVLFESVIGLLQIWTQNWRAVIILIIFRFVLWSQYLPSLWEDLRQVVVGWYVYISCFSFYNSRDITSITCRKFFLVRALYSSSQFILYVLSWDSKNFFNMLLCYVFLIPSALALLFTISTLFYFDI